MHAVQKICTPLFALTLLASVAAVSSAKPQGDTAAAWPAETCPIKSGEMLPSVAVQSSDGIQIDLAEAVKEKPTLLVFYRGGW